MIKLTKEAYRVLKEIIGNEAQPNYWQQKFENLSNKEDSILRGCFKELSEADMISTVWADNHPYIIQVLKDGYLYDEHMKEEERVTMSRFERELNDLLERAKSIKSPINEGSTGTDISARNQLSEDWMNDVSIFSRRYLTEHELSVRVHNLLVNRSHDCIPNLVSCLASIAKDQNFIDKTNEIEKKKAPVHQSKTRSKYDVFLSHANADKQDFVDDLYSSLKKFIDTEKIFYDKKSIGWGDKWKDKILDGTKKAEFAIIVISENFFDREWTEKELSEFLGRQNENDQKIILPIIHNITFDDLHKKYPSIANIQTIDSKEYSCDEIAFLFARELINRLKAEG